MPGYPIVRSYSHSAVSSSVSKHNFSPVERGNNVNRLSFYGTTWISIKWWVIIESNLFSLPCCSFLQTVGISFECRQQSLKRKDTTTKSQDCSPLPCLSCPHDLTSPFREQYEPQRSSKPLSALQIIYNSASIHCNFTLEKDEIKELHSLPETSNVSIPSWRWISHKECHYLPYVAKEYIMSHIYLTESHESASYLPTIHREFSQTVFKYDFHCAMCVS